LLDLVGSLGCNGKAFGIEKKDVGSVSAAAAASVDDAAFEAASVDDVVVKR
jgi:hypothetical protein